MHTLLHTYARMHTRIHARLNHKQVVVRRLPPGLTAEAFQAAVDKVLPEGSYTWFSYNQGKVRCVRVRRWVRPCGTAPSSRLVHIVPAPAQHRAHIPARSVCAHTRASPHRHNARISTPPPHPHRPLHPLTPSLRKTVLSRAYLNFADPAAVLEFKARFDGHAFITARGSHFKCAVEYAPFQKVPNPPKRRNPLEGTIEEGGWVGGRAGGGNCVALRE